MTQVSQRCRRLLLNLRDRYNLKFKGKLALGSNIGDQDAKNFEIDALTLRFVDARSESAFVSSRAAKLARYMTIGCFFFDVYIACVLGSQIQSGWLTCGGALIDTPEAHAIGSSRNTLFFVVFAVVAAQIPIWVGNRKWQFLSPKGQEFLATFTCCWAMLSIIVQHPWYFSKILGVQDRAPLFITGSGIQDFEVLLYVDIFASCTHLLCPVCWSVFWIYEAITVTVFLAMMSTIGVGTSDGSWLICAGTVTILMCVSSFGMRNSELFERTQFAQVACERVLRAQAEFRLHEAMSSRLGSSSAEDGEVAGADGAGGNEQKAGGMGMVDLDVNGLPVEKARSVEQVSEVTYKTGTTGEVFRLGGAASKQDVEVTLQKITALGIQEHWLINPGEVKPFPDAVLGRGSFGVVLRGSYHGAAVALKASIDPSTENVLARSFRSAIEELRIFRRLRHPNIVLFYGACIDPATCDVLLVLEYIQGQQLHTAIPPYPAAVVADLGPRCKLADDICCALAYLHAQQPNIIHGDIKSTNVLVENASDRPRAKLLDFGLSRLLTRTARKLGGTLRWMAPEVITQKPGSIATSADVFSFGRLLYMLMTGKLPLENVGRSDIIAAAKRGEILPLDWPTQMLFDRKSRELCDACLRLDANARPSIVEVQTRLRSWQVDSLQACTPAPEAELSAALQQARQSCGSASAAAPLSPKEKRKDSKAELLHPGYSQTPHESCRLSIAQAMCSWNLPIKTSDCCSYHVLIRKACEISHDLNASTCSRFKPDVNGQCPECHLIGHVWKGECSACGFRSLAVASSFSTANSGLAEQLESIQEATTMGSEEGATGAVSLVQL